MTTSTIRGYRPDDRGEMLALFAAAGRDSPTESLWGDLSSEAQVYLYPYLDLEPGSTLVAEDEWGLAGYLTGCLDSAAFPSEDERFGSALTARVFARPRAIRFFAIAAFDIAVRVVTRGEAARELRDPRWPSHLHINVVPRHRGDGTADGLMNAWIAAMRAAGSPGCYLQTLVENPRAVRFFARHGFRPYGRRPRVPGVRVNARPAHQQTMVWTNDQTSTVTDRNR